MSSSSIIVLCLDVVPHSSFPLLSGVLRLEDLFYDNLQSFGDEKCQFFVTLVFIPGLMWSSSYFLMQRMEIRPVGAPISLMIKDLVSMLFMSLVLFCLFDRQIWEVIYRFDEAKRLKNAQSESWLTLDKFASI